MPTYQYQCESCGHELEEFQYIAEPPLTHCPRCNNESLVRIIGTGAGLIFKGTGFYLTDYKKEASPAKTPRHDKGKAEGETSSTGETKKTPPAAPPAPDKS